jgi:hypothetical protein
MRRMLVDMWARFPEHLAHWLDEKGVDSFNRTFLFDLVERGSELSQPDVEWQNWCACCVKATDYHEDEKDMVLTLRRQGLQLTRLKLTRMPIPWTTATRVLKRPWLTQKRRVPMTSSRLKAPAQAQAQAQAHARPKPKVRRKVALKIAEYEDSELAATG